MSLGGTTRNRGVSTDGELWQRAKIREAGKGKEEELKPQKKKEVLKRSYGREEEEDEHEHEPGMVRRPLESCEALPGA